MVFPEDLDALHDKRFVLLMDSIKHGTFDDQNMIQVEIVPCLVCKMKEELYNLDCSSEVDDGLREVTSQKLAGSLFKLTPCTGSCVLHACAGYLLMLDTMSQGNEGRIVESCRADFRCQPSQQYEMAVFLAGINRLKRRRIQIGEEVKPKRARVDGLQLDLTVGKMNFTVLSVPEECSSSNWSSLHELLLWMIKDKLDIFDNQRFAAICRDWRSASARYPKSLSRVGDGLPWLLRMRKDLPKTSREFLSIPRKSKFIVNMPELSDCIVLFSKQGWILLRKKAGSGSLWIVNPLTRAKIELPAASGIGSRPAIGSFTTRDEYPERVFLIITEEAHRVTIKTACPGDELWTDHYYPGLERSFLHVYKHITIGRNVYCRDSYSYLTVFNVANDSVKVVPPVSSFGFIAERDGQLLYIDKYGYEEDSFRGFSVYRYDDSCWERLDTSAVMNTSWYLCPNHSCISARESGLKIYMLVRRRADAEGRYHRGFSSPRSCVVFVYDLLAGSMTTLPNSFPGLPSWIAIG